MPEDLPIIVKMGKQFFQESEIQSLAEWDEESVSQIVSALIENQLFFVAERNHVVIGMIASVVTPLWFNPSVTMAQEFFWYVNKGERGGVGIKLLNAMEREAKAQGVDALIMVSLDKLPSLDGLYQRCGYIPSEKIFIKRL